MLRKGLWALILAGTLMGSVSLYQEITGDYDNDFGGLAKVKEATIDTGRTNDFGEDIERRRLAGTIGSKNRYAQVMVVLLPIALMRVWAEKSRALKLVGALTCIPILSGALLTFSRGAGISIVGTLLVMALLRIIKIWHLVVVVFAASLFVYFAIPDYVYRISTVSDLTELASDNPEEASGSFRGRATENLAALYIFLDNPVLGVGPGQANLYTMDYGNEVGYRRLNSTRRAHDMYLEELADTGILGFGVFMSIVLYTLYRLKKLSKKWAAIDPKTAFTLFGILLAIIAYLSTALFLHLSYVRYYYLILAIAGAAIQIYSDQITNKDVLERDSESSRLVRG